jgi:hypothetical protein
MRAKEAEDKQEKEAALAEMKALSEKLMLEGYARQVALLDLRAREDRVKQQLALLSKSFAAFSSKDSSSSSPHAAASASPAASANHDAADVPRCIEAIKKIQAKIHGGANEGILISALGLALNPKVHFSASYPTHTVLNIFMYHFSDCFFPTLKALAGQWPLEAVPFRSSAGNHFLHLHSHAP